MGEWIPMQVDLSQHPAVLHIAEKTSLNPDDVAGKLLRVWGWARERTTNGKIPGGTAFALDNVARVQGFAQAMSGAVGDGGHQWLEIGDGFLRFTKWEKWLSNGAKQRAKDQARKRRDREKQNADKAGTQSGQDADRSGTGLGTNLVPEVRGVEVKVRGDTPHTSAFRGVGVNGALPETPRIHSDGDHTTHPHPDRAICKRILEELRWRKQERGKTADDRISRPQLGKLLAMPGCTPIRVHMLCERVKRGEGKQNPATWIHAGIDQKWEVNGADETAYREWYASIYGVAERLAAIRARGAA